MADEQTTGVTTPRARRFAGLFLMAAGGLAAPSLALAAFFLSNSGETDSPAARSGIVPGAGVTTTTAPRRTTATTSPTATTTTTVPAAPAANPPRDPFVPLVIPASPGGASGEVRR